MKQNNYFQHLEKSAYSTLSAALTTVNISEFSPELRSRVDIIEKERIQNWFVTPLKNFSGDDSIACMMILFPLLEKIIRFELGIKPENMLDTGETSEAMKRLAKLVKIPQKNARHFWDCFRHGLMHRAMIKGNTKYILNPEEGPGSPVKVDKDVVVVYVWRLRNTVVSLLEKHGKQLWKDESHPFPQVF